MNDVLLVRKINPDESLETYRTITVNLGQMHKASTCDTIVEVLEALDFIRLSSLIIKYNGITLDIKTADIPKLLSALIENDILVYSVYELYN